MIDILKRFFGKADGGGASPADSEHDLHVATCALFVELARIDGEFSSAETETILTILKDRYGLSAAYADVLLQEADRELADSLDLWQFARLINDNYSNTEKMEIIEILWRMVFVDGKMDAHEHYLMNKLRNLLRLSHEDVIAVKLKVKRS